jgi:DNA-binding IclR family transcriptional regulator
MVAEEVDRLDAVETESYAEAAQIRSVVRAMDLVRLLGQYKSGASVTELASVLRMPKSTVYRLLVTLKSADWVVSDPETERYRLGIGLLEVSAGVLNALSLRDLAKPHLEALWQAANESVHLGVLHGQQIVYVMKYESTQAVRMYSEVGKTAPVYCTGLGKALLAWTEQTRRRDLLSAIAYRRFTPNTLTDPAVLEEDLKQARERGYAIDNAEHEDFVRCVAAAISGGSDTPVGAISIAAPLHRMTDARVAELGAMVAERARMLEKEVRCVPPHRFKG